MGEGGTEKHTDKQTHSHTDTHINTMTRPGLGAGPSEKQLPKAKPNNYLIRLSLKKQQVKN